MIIGAHILAHILASSGLQGTLLAMTGGKKHTRLYALHTFDLTGLKKSLYNAGKIGVVMTSSLLGLNDVITGSNELLDDYIATLDDSIKKD